MRKIIIEVPDPGDEEQSLDVVLQDGRRCGGLCWGEMVEQIAGLTLNKEASTERYRMLTSEEWEALRTLRKARTAATADRVTPKLKDSHEHKDRSKSTARCCSFERRVRRSIAERGADSCSQVPLMGG